MVELAISIKLSAGEVDFKRGMTQKNWTKVIVCAVSLPLILLGVWRGKITVDIYFAPENITAAKTFFFDWFAPTIFILLSISLTIACACLISRMNKYFDRSLKDEGCRIAIIFLVFTISYLTRATTYFVLDAIGDVPSLAYHLVYYIGYIFWDVIPLTIVMIFHLKRIKQVVVDDPNESLLEDRNSLPAQSMHLFSTSMLESDPEFAEILILNKDLNESRLTAELAQEKGNHRSSQIGDGTEAETSRQDEDELSSSGDEISVPSRSMQSTLGESSGEEGVDKVTFPYVEHNKLF